MVKARIDISQGGGKRTNSAPSLPALALGERNWATIPGCLDSVLMNVPCVQYNAEKRRSKRLSHGPNGEITRAESYGSSTALLNHSAEYCVLHYLDASVAIVIIFDFILFSPFLPKNYSSVLRFYSSQWFFAPSSHSIDTMEGKR